MTTLAIACQIIVALGIFNVWLVRRDRPTPYRPEGADSIQEEFRRYGLPGWAWMAVGAAKVSLAVLLLVGVFVPPVAPVAGGAIAVMMVSAIAAHLRVNDPLMKSLPAFLMLLLSTVVVVAYTV